MKEVFAIIRMNKVNQTKKALVEAGFNSLTAIKVLGRGKMLKDLATLNGLTASDELREKLVEGLLQGGRLIPKRLLSIVVRDDEVKKVVETIIGVNKSGNPGDGKIFVLPIAEAVRVRTGERGDSAI